MNPLFEWAPLLTVEKFNERSGLNYLPFQARKGALIWKFAMSAEALIQIVWKNDKTRVFFGRISFVFYNKKFTFRKSLERLGKLKKSCLLCVV